MNIQEFLGRRNIPFQVLQHRETFDAQRMAQSVHESGHHVAKTVLLRVDGDREYVVAVLPASHNLDFAKLEKVLPAPQIEVGESEEIGAEPVHLPAVSESLPEEDADDANDRGWRRAVAYWCCRGRRDPLRADQQRYGRGSDGKQGH